jgi:hypothetical protein
MKNEFANRTPMNNIIPTIRIMDLILSSANILPTQKNTQKSQINAKAIQYRLLVTSSLYRKCKYTARNRSAVMNDSVSNEKTNRIVELAI